MSTINALLLRLHLLLLPPPGQRDRGDVPGWVMITVMSAGIVAVIGVAAEDQLSAMLKNALGKVR